MASEACHYCDSDWERSLILTRAGTITSEGSSKHNCSAKQAKNADDGEEDSLLIEDNHQLFQKSTKREIR